MKAVIRCGLSCEACALSEEKLQRLEKIFSEYLEGKKLLPEAVVECEISLVLANADKMAELNAEYRKTSGPTDVLSFPMWEDGRGGFAPPEGWASLPLGDIIVCPEIVAKNAEENEKSAESETALVICHGFLHLLGFDHADDGEREAMWRAQDSLVARFLEEEVRENGA